MSRYGLFFIMRSDWNRRRVAKEFRIPGSEFKVSGSRVEISGLDQILNFSLHVEAINNIDTCRRHLSPAKKITPIQKAAAVID